VRVTGGLIQRPRLSSIRIPSA